MKRAFKTSVANCNYSLINDIQAAMRYRSRGSLNGASVCELGMISIKGFISLVYTKSHFKVYFREKEEQKHLLLKHQTTDTKQRGRYYIIFRMSGQSVTWSRYRDQLWSVIAINGGMLWSVTLLFVLRLSLPLSSMIARTLPITRWEPLYRELV